MERILKLTALTDDLARLETQKRDVAMQHLLIINQEKALEEGREKLETAKAVLNATLDRIDSAFLVLYPAASPAAVAMATVEVIKEQAAAPVEEPKKQRGKKGKEAAPPVEEKPADDKAAQRLAILADPAAPPCAKCHAASECSDCCKSCISPCDTKQVCRVDNPAETVGVCSKCEGEGMYIEDGIEDGGGETYCDCPAGVALKENDAARVPADSADAGEGQPRETATASFQPLDEPVGNCELCMGYGVIDGELYGEATLVPCTCPAGLKVKGGDLTGRPCDNCNIEDPDCASCHLPDMALADILGVPKCANGSCTATGRDAKDICMRVQDKDCKSFAPLDQCKHDLMKRVKNADGSVTCGVCDFVIRPAGSVDPASGKSVSKEEPKEVTQPTALQQKCPHPKPFREETPEGIVCKVCKLVLSGN